MPDEEASPGEYYGKKEVGLASWYGKDFHGRPTASGEIYDMDDMTAAHKYAPLGAWAYVSHLENGRSVLVKINDRGPFVRGRIIDLSRGAARALGMEHEGVAKVRVEFLSSPPPEAESRTGMTFTLQFGSFIDRDKAERLTAELSKLFSDVYLEEAQVAANNFYRVRMGRYSSRQQAKTAAEEVSAAGYDSVIMVK